MKHAERLAAILVTAVLVVCYVAVTGYAQNAPSVPNLIAYQGLVTLAGGSPVANGSYPATFTIYNYSSGGASLWSENANVTTNGGRFSHNLGSVSALPATLSYSNDSLWLAITFNGELLTPRSRIVGNAFSLTANNLEGNNGVGVVSLRANSNAHQISQYGNDGGEQMRLWGPSYAELVMDGNAIDNATDDILLSTNSGAGSILRLRKPGGTAGAVLHSGGAGAGGSLTLTNDAGTSTVFMDGDLSSDVSVLLPAGAISSTEEFNEPGAASDIVNPSASIADHAFTTLATRTINAPGAGYVLALGSLQARVQGSFYDSVNIGISTSPSSLPVSQQTPLIYTHGFNDILSLPVTVQGLFSVGAGVTTFYLLAEDDTSYWTAGHRKLTLVYLPTSYGTIDSPSAPDGGSDLSSAPDYHAERDASAAVNNDRMARELEMMRIQAAEQTERIRRLEEAVGSQRSGNALVNPEK